MESIWEYVTNFEPVLVFTFSVAGFVAIAALALLVQVLILRAFLNAKNARRLRFSEKWRPILAETLFKIPEMPLKIKPNERCFFIDEWNHMHELLEGDSKRQLNKLAKILKIDRFALQILQSKHFRERLTAIITLGHLREFAAWDDLKEICSQENSLISLAALQALMQIDAKNCIQTAIQLISIRADWPTARIAHILRHTSANILSEPLISYIDTARTEESLRLLPYLFLTHTQYSSPTIRKLLNHTVDDRVIAACLQAINDPFELPTIRNFLDHKRWHIRVHAVTALGRLGEKQDVERLTRLLSDSQWWVRYRAAQALAKLPFVDLHTLKNIQTQLDDRYASDILVQVIAEKQVQWTSS